VRRLSTAPLSEVLAGKRLVVLVGQGGVGKTSVSAAIAWSRATAGERVAVLTIDPAPRLGDALGLAAIDGEPRLVELPPSARGSLTAMRLDTKRTFDRMIEQHAPSRDTAERLLAHPLYRSISTQLGGTESYMAFQRLHELAAGGDHDCLVVDTPPAANAASLLEAPARLTGLLDTGALSILADPARVLTRAGSSIARATLWMLLAAMEKVTGASLQKGVGEFVDLAGDLVSGLEQRARDIEALLRSPTTAFILVTRPRTRDVESALAFRRDLERMGIGVDAIIVNRLTRQRSARTGGAERFSALPERLHESARRMESDVDALREIEAAALNILESSLPRDAGPPIYAVPARELDIASLDDIAELAADLQG
jgi:anion-transporting  ArsA/GET3 family ATPase